MHYNIEETQAGKALMKDLNAMMAQSQSYKEIEVQEISSLIRKLMQANVYKMMQQAKKKPESQTKALTKKV